MGCDGCGVFYLVRGGSRWSHEEDGWDGMGWDAMDVVCFTSYAGAVGGATKRMGGMGWDGMRWMWCVLPRTRGQSVEPRRGWVGWDGMGCDGCGVFYLVRGGSRWSHEEDG